MDFSALDKILVHDKKKELRQKVLWDLNVCAMAETKQTNFLRAVNYFSPNDVITLFGSTIKKDPNFAQLTIVA